MKIAIAGDLHGSWSADDFSILSALQPDAVLFVGDLGESDLRPAKLLKEIPFPTAIILGNHDRGYDKTGQFLERELKLLGNLHCGWRLKQWSHLELSIVGGRPCSAGGGFYLAPEVQAVFGSLTIEESASRIFSAAEKAPMDSPLVVLAHSGPTGLGSDAWSPCGRDWKTPSIDWGDQDLALAIAQIRKFRIPDLVVFGHMHHQLKKTKKNRISFYQDCYGVKYLNAACVPRVVMDENGEQLTHFSWVEFLDKRLIHISHRWFRRDASVAFQELLFS